LMIAGSANVESNPNSSWLSTRGAWAAYCSSVFLLFIFLFLVISVPTDYVYTATNVLHNFAMYIIMHQIKGAPWLAVDQGECRRLTFWEQIDSGVQFTATKKFMSVFPILLFLITNIANNYKFDHFLVNLLSLFVVLLPKSPQFHKVRVFGINKY
ncbi:ORM1-like protein 3, partial [Trichinella pseudospiralis]